jgi:hypothetical protein
MGLHCSIGSEHTVCTLCSVCVIMPQSTYPYPSVAAWRPYVMNWWVLTHEVLLSSAQGFSKRKQRLYISFHYFSACIKLELYCVRMLDFKSELLPLLTHTLIKRVLAWDECCVSNNSWNGSQHASVILHYTFMQVAFSALPSIKSKTLTDSVNC